MPTRRDHFAAALTWELIRHGFIQVRDPEHPTIVAHSPSTAAAMIAVTDGAYVFAYILRPTVPSRPSLGDGRISTVRFALDTDPSVVAARIARLERQCNPAADTDRQRVFDTLIDAGPA